MRSAFFRALGKLFRTNDKVYFITGDVGYKLFDEIKSHDPQRVINAGIREAAIIGIASGLAKEGMLPFVYSIVPFITLRCMEQIKIDACYHNLKVNIVGVGGGFSYGPNGPTHHGIDDLGHMRMLPNMTVLSPIDPHDVELCVAACESLSGPAYIRLGRNGEKNLPVRGLQREIFKAQIVEEGQDATIVITGPIILKVLSAAQILRKKNINCRIVKISCIKPFDELSFSKCLLKGKPLISVEEHIGGHALSQLISDFLTRNGHHAVFKPLYIPDTFPKNCMSHEKLLEWSGLDEMSLVAIFERVIKEYP